MQRLFLAIAIPEPQRSELLRLMPSPRPGIRIVERSQVHLTLHFIGIASASEIVNAIQPIRLSPFEIEFEKPGVFRPSVDTAIFWAGIRPSEALNELHQSLSKVLINLGIKIESRPYTPHVTLARGKSLDTDTVVDQFLSNKFFGVQQPFRVSDFRLYSSVLRTEGPQYRVEHLFPLEQR